MCGLKTLLWTGTDALSGQEDAAARGRRGTEWGVAVRAALRGV
jgi:hypothetical protein